MRNESITQELADELIPNVISGWRLWLSNELEKCDDDGLEPLEACDRFCEHNVTKILADIHKAGKHDYDTLQTILNDQRLLFESYSQLLANLMVANDEINGSDEN